MLEEYASRAWAEIIGAAAVSLLGIIALAILVVGFVVIALVRRNDTFRARLVAIVALMAFFIVLALISLYNVNPTVTQSKVAAEAPSHSFAPGAQVPAITSQPLPTRPTARLDCGVAWSGWTNPGAAVGNPCPSGCTRGAELGQSYRVVGFPPHPQTQHKFQCWRG